MHRVILEWNLNTPLIGDLMKSSNASLLNITVLSCLAFSQLASAQQKNDKSMTEKALAIAKVSVGQVVKDGKANTLTTATSAQASVVQAKDIKKEQGGTFDGGGANALKGKLLESYLIEITADQIYKQDVEPLLLDVKVKLPQLYDILQRGLIRSLWYFVPTEVYRLANHQIGAPIKAEVEQPAVQSFHEVWVDKNQYDKVLNRNEKKTLIVHEIVLAALEMTRTAYQDRATIMRETRRLTGIILLTRSTNEEMLSLKVQESVFKNRALTASEIALEKAREEEAKRLTELAAKMDKENVENLMKHVRFIESKVKEFVKANKVEFRKYLTNGIHDSPTDKFLQEYIELVRETSPTLFAIRRFSNGLSMSDVRVQSLTDIHEYKRILAELNKNPFVVKSLTKFSDSNFASYNIAVRELPGGSKINWSVLNLAHADNLMPSKTGDLNLRIYVSSSEAWMISAKAAYQAFYEDVID